MFLPKFPTHLILHLARHEGQCKVKVETSAASSSHIETAQGAGQANRCIVTSLQLPAIDIPSSSSHFDRQMKSLQIRDQSRVSPRDIHKIAPVRQQLLVS